MTPIAFLFVGIVGFAGTAEAATVQAPQPVCSDSKYFMDPVQSTEACACVRASGQDWWADVYELEDWDPTGNWDDRFEESDSCFNVSRVMSDPTVSGHWAAGEIYHQLVNLADFYARNNPAYPGVGWSQARDQLHSLEDMDDDGGPPALIPVPIPGTLMFDIFHPDSLTRLATLDSGGLMPVEAVYFDFTGDKVEDVWLLMPDGVSWYLEGPVDDTLIYVVPPPPPSTRP